MIGQTISHYKIVEKLGEGGMGIVYKAQDLTLDRLVALKFLPQHLTANETEKARFLQEAKAASALNHPNVCIIYGIEEHKGQQFIEMEYVDGKTLREMILGRGEVTSPLRMGDVISYAIQIGDALQEAHSKGIVHRDIKADNIMVNSKNQIKVMDFGLAKLKGSLKLTKTSSTVGTLSYMAPEQIQGGEVDARSDIFSFGVVLYEMFTGKLPFRGEHDAAMMYSILNEEPDSLHNYLPEVPPELERIVHRALEKDPEDRYQHVDDLVSELRRVKKQSTRVSRTFISPGIAVPASEPTSRTIPTPESSNRLSGKNKKVWIAAGGFALVGAMILGYLLIPFGNKKPSGMDEQKRIAVLPFENLGTADQDYFADGLTEEITNRLSGISGLGVIARTSAMQYKKTTKTLKEIGSELGVGYVLQGTIRWGTSQGGGARVRVSPVLIQIEDGTQVWAQPYDAVFSDVFKVQSDIATQVAGALGISLLQPERKTLDVAHTENSEAYDLYLRGIDYYRRSYREQDFQIAIQMFVKAVELDPKFALAFAKLSETHSAMYWFFYDHTKKRLDKAKAAVDEALRLDPSLPDAHASLGYYYYWGFLDYDNALKELAIAQKSRPSDSRVQLGIGAVQRRQGKFELAAATMTKASEIDPRYSEIAFNAAQTYALLRNYAEAERYIDRSISLTPDVSSRYLYKAFFYVLWSGDTKRAREVIQQASRISGAEDDIGVLLFQTRIEIYEGNYKEALNVLSSHTMKSYDDQFQFIPPAQLFAEIYGLTRVHELERTYYDSARVLIEKKILEVPDDARFHSSLGIVYAGLGRKEEAIREGKRGVEIMPITKEAWRGTYRVRDLAQIYLMTGEQSEALDLLESLLSRPSDLSGSLLRIDPVWASLRNNPRFQKLITEKK